MEGAAGSSTGRVHWVDWLKVLVVLGIGVYHVALVFSLTSWMITNKERSLFLSAFAGWGYLFGLQLLFVLAGTASYYGRRSRTALRFAGERLLRLGVPLVIGAILLSPLQAYFQALGNGSRAAFLDWLPGYVQRLTFPRDPVWLLHTTYHLWFLGFLLIISIAALPVQWGIDRLPGAGRMRALANIGLRPGWVLLGAVPVAVVQVLLRQWAPTDMSWADLTADLVFYLLGYGLAASPGFADAVRRSQWTSLGGALVGWIGLGVLFLVQALPGWSHPYGLDLDVLIYASLHALGCWGFICFISATAMLHWNRPSPTVTYCSEAILPFYVIHHPLVVVFSYYIVQLPLGVWPKFFLLLAAVFSGTFAIYEFVVRRFGPLRVLFGLHFRPGGGRSKRARSRTAISPA